MDHLEQLKINCIGGDVMLKFYYCNHNGAAGQPHYDVIDLPVGCKLKYLTYYCPDGAVDQLLIIANMSTTYADPPSIDSTTKNEIFKSHFMVRLDPCIIYFPDVTVYDGHITIAHYNHYSGYMIICVDV